MNKQTKQNGFTLVEIAIVLVIVGLIIGGLMMPLSVQLEQRRVNETQKTLDDARESLIGFALRNGYLPCPAISASIGLEDRVGGACRDGKRLGYLPWATLGLPKLDSWNHLLRYSVSPAFANSTVTFNLRSLRDISIATRDARGQLAPASMSNDIVAVIMSHGKNGHGATSEQGVLQPAPELANADERVNLAPGGRAFISRPINDNGKFPGGEFDDLVIWLSPNILYNRMVLAQRLP